MRSQGCESHLGQQATHGMTHDDGRGLQRGEFFFQVGGVIQKAGGAQCRGRRLLIMTAMGETSSHRRSEATVPKLIVAARRERDGLEREGVRAQIDRDRTAQEQRTGPVHEREVGRDVRLGGEALQPVHAPMPWMSEAVAEPKDSVSTPGQPPENAHLASLVGLVWRTVVLWLILLALLTIARLLG